MKKTVFVGDSLTAGCPGVSYWRFLHNKQNLINQGVGGDTLLGASARVSRMLRNRKYEDVERYVLEIGTNDVLLPVLKYHSRTWKAMVRVKELTMGCVPCDDIEMFRDRYETLLLRLISRKKKVAVIGLPYNENCVLKLNDRLGSYNAVVEELCKKYKVIYINLRELEKNSLHGKRGSYFFGKTMLGTIIDTVFTSFMPFSNAVSRWRGLSVTVDGIHLNQRMAKKLAKLIEIRLTD